MNHCTKSLLTLALGLGLQSAVFAQAPSESAKPKPSVTATHAPKTGTHAQHVAKPEHAVSEKTSQPMAAGTKSASPKPAGDKMMPNQSTAKDKTNVAAKSVSKTKKVSKPEASPELNKPMSK